jgi:hypothetical protein
VPGSLIHSVTLRFSRRLKVCHAFCKLHELSPRQPSLSCTATSFLRLHFTRASPGVAFSSSIPVAASPPAASVLARLRVARAAAKASQILPTDYSGICACFSLAALRRLLPTDSSPARYVGCPRP